jgi:3-oxoacyl-[acyl-carrier protein] reductase
MELGIQGKRALVTGGSHGIGLAIAAGLAAEGCAVAICSRTKKRLGAAERQLRAVATKTLCLQADVFNDTDILRTTREIDKAWGGVDILVNNVGGGGRWGKETIEVTPEEVWAQVYQKNAGAAIAFSRWAIPEMRRRKWGRIVAISSIHGREAGGRPWFTMAKAAQIAMNKSLAVQPYLARDGITFNTVAAGSIMVADTGWADERAKDPAGFAIRMDKEFPLGRLGTPEEVAAVVLFLCSAHSAYVNGACIPVDGGESRAF